MANSNNNSTTSVMIYNEKFEKEVSNIVGRNSIRVEQEGHETVWCLKDPSVLVVELMDYILKNNEKK